MWHWCRLRCSMIETRASRSVGWLAQYGKRLGRIHRRPLDMDALVSLLVFHTFYDGLCTFLQVILCRLPPNLSRDTVCLRSDVEVISSVPVRLKILKEKIQFISKRDTLVEPGKRRKVYQIWSESDQYQVSYDFHSSVSFVSSRGTWRQAAVNCRQDWVRLTKQFRFVENS